MFLNVLNNVVSFFLDIQTCDRVFRTGSRSQGATLCDAKWQRWVCGHI